MRTETPMPTATDEKTVDPTTTPATFNQYKRLYVIRLFIGAGIGEVTAFSRRIGRVTDAQASREPIMARKRAFVVPGARSGLQATENEYLAAVDSVENIVKSVSTFHALIFDLRSSLIGFLEREDISLQSQCFLLFSDDPSQLIWRFRKCRRRK
ncbi:hypothetical protein MPH_04245 [Macrophomina phaseolina MS6]|uniref:Uncharacterized protein n=1 Tax=Macrophomina phaseolina (strain MS6) TaxID=1126212 RepID=K2RUH3_MACPH|nr:hypothetical protein MPH_04245 [Macrophomina phaseolina MS6]